MDDPSVVFVNRFKEIQYFRDLISEDHRRLLLIYGLVGRGKTCLRQQLAKLCREEQMKTVVVDFQRAKLLTDTDIFIDQLSERLGSGFAAKQAQAREEICSRRAVDPAALAETLAKALSSSPSGEGSSSVTLSGQEKVAVGGSIVGRDQTILDHPTIILHPDSGKMLGLATDENLNNVIFRAALKNFLAEQKRLIFFLDHYEDATVPISGWVSDHLLNLLLEEAEGFSNLWIIVSGQRVPLLDEIDDWRHIVGSQQIDPLPAEAIYLVWNDRCKGKKDVIDAFIMGSGGNTKLLFLFLQNYVENLPKE